MWKDIFSIFFFYHFAYSQIYRLVNQSTANGENISKQLYKKAFQYLILQLHYKKPALLKHVKSGKST